MLENLSDTTEVSRSYFIGPLKSEPERVGKELNESLEVFYLGYFWKPAFSYCK